jgi:hypothetical protein
MVIVSTARSILAKISRASQPGHTADGKSCNEDLVGPWKITEQEIDLHFSALTIIDPITITDRTARHVHWTRIHYHRRSKHRRQISADDGQESAIKCHTRTRQSDNWQHIPHHATGQPGERYCQRQQ